MKDAVATMGNLLPDDAAGRDAVHVAVFSATSDEVLLAGQHVALVGKNNTDHKVSKKGDCLGIVDPFIKGKILPGSRFWVYLYPRTITALAHKWNHPAFEDKESDEIYTTPHSKLESEEWLREFCESHDAPSYYTLMTEIQKHFSSENPLELPSEAYDSYDVSSHIDNDYFYFRGTDAHCSIPSEFWYHVENVIGRKVHVRPEYFTCSC